MGMEVGFAAFIDEPPVIEINGSIVRINYRRLGHRARHVGTDASAFRRAGQACP
jgi:hypothetical protein